MSDHPQHADHLLKVSCLLTRRADLTHEEFHRYWTEQHTLMLAQPQPGGPKVFRYVQLHPIAETVPGLPTAPYDGVAEVWFANLADAAAMFTSDHYNTVVAADEEHFLDRAKTVFLYAYEKPIILCSPTCRRGAIEKEKRGVRFSDYGAYELVLHDNPFSFLGPLWTVP